MQSLLGLLALRDVHVNPDGPQRVAIIVALDDPAQTQHPLVAAVETAHAMLHADVRRSPFDVVVQLRHHPGAVGRMDHGDRLIVVPRAFLRRITQHGDPTVVDDQIARMHIQIPRGQPGPLHHKGETVLAFPQPSLGHAAPGDVGNDAEDASGRAVCIPLDTASPDLQPHRRARLREGPTLECQGFVETFGRSKPVDRPIPIICVQPLPPGGQGFGEFVGVVAQQGIDLCGELHGVRRQCQFKNSLIHGRQRFTKTRATLLQLRLGIVTIGGKALCGK